jgi:peroxiredoxin
MFNKQRSVYAMACLSLDASPQLRGGALPLLACVVLVSSVWASTAEEQFEALRTRYKSQQEQVWADAEKAKNQEERASIFRQRDPANTMYGEFLKLEEENRGTIVGISTLHHLISLAYGSYGGNPDFPVTAGGQQAMRVLAAHYADHPNLDIFFSWIKNANEAKALLRSAMESPHRHVRAAATLSLAEQFKNDAIIPSMLDATLNLMAEDREKFTEDIARYTKSRQRWGRVDSEVSRREALHLLDQVMVTYGDVPEPPRTGYGPILLTVDRSLIDPLTTKPRRPLSQLAESMRTELTELTIGQPAPEITAPDAFGREMKLSDFRGKVTVLMFSFKGCGPCEAMYPTNRKLIETYRDRPFTFLGVMGDESIDTVKASIEGKAITWPVWWDGGGTHGPLATRWNVTGWPEIYVLDHKGIIRYREIHGEILAKAVAKLVEAAEKLP